MLTLREAAAREEIIPQILVVDDTPMNAELLAEGLGGEYRVRVAADGPTALAIAQGDERPDLILLDVLMPGMDGYEVCRRLREDPRTRDIPVIFVTALNESENEERGLDLGAVDYIIRPFHLAVVKARIRNHLRLKLKSDLLESLALVDGLTLLPNRRHFESHLDAEWKRALRSGDPLSVLMIKIDGFEAYNDHYGHGLGDERLRLVAGLLRRSLVRPGAVAARHDGDEFAILIPESENGVARMLAEQLRQSVAELGIPHAASTVAPHLTVSVGHATTVVRRGRKAEGLLSCAERMLAEARAAGGNCIRGGECP